MTLEERQFFSHSWKVLALVQLAQNSFLQKNCQKMPSKISNCRNMTKVKKWESDRMELDLIKVQSSTKRLSKMQITSPQEEKMCQLRPFQCGEGISKRRYKWSKKVTSSMKRVYFSSPLMQELFGIKINLVGRKRNGEKGTQKKERKKDASSYNIYVTCPCCNEVVCNNL